MTTIPPLPLGTGTTPRDLHVAGVPEVENTEFVDFGQAFEGLLRDLEGGVNTSKGVQTAGIDGEGEGTRRDDSNAEQLVLPTAPTPSKSLIGFRLAQELKLPPQINGQDQQEDADLQTASVGADLASEPVKVVRRSQDAIPQGAQQNDVLALEQAQFVAIPSNGTGEREPKMASFSERDHSKGEDQASPVRAAFDFARRLSETALLQTRDQPALEAGQSERKILQETRFEVVNVERSNNLPPSNDAAVSADMHLAGSVPSRNLDQSREIKNASANMDIARLKHVGVSIDSTRIVHPRAEPGTQRSVSPRFSENPNMSLMNVAEPSPETDEQVHMDEEGVSPRPDSKYAFTEGVKGFDGDLAKFKLGNADNPDPQKPLVRFEAATTAPKTENISKLPLASDAHATIGEKTTLVTPVGSERIPLEILGDKNQLHSLSADLVSDDLMGRERIPSLIKDVAVLAEVKIPQMRAIPQSEVMQQITHVVRTSPNGPVEIALSPEELGQVRMSMTSSETSISVTILAERAETLDLLRRHYQQLEQEFRSMGYDEVSFSFEQQQEQKKQPKQSEGGASMTHEAVHEDAMTYAEIGPDGGLDLRL